MSVVMSVVTRSMGKVATPVTKTPVTKTPVTKTPVTKTPVTKTKTNKYNLRNMLSVNYADISSDDDEKDELVGALAPPVVKEYVPPPPATLATDSDLERLNLKPGSRDPSGYLIVVKATELEYIFVCQMGQQIQGKWAIAPPGYYWIHLSQKCYYWFDWVELRRIPV
jgi:hypothetical protein